MKKRLVPIAVTAALLVLVFAPMDWGRNRGLWNGIGNAGHYPFLALITLLLFRLLRHRGRLVRYAGAGTLACAAAVGIELLQPLVSRTGSVGDAINGLLGVTAALIGIYVWRELGNWSLRVAHAVLSLTILIVLLGPPWGELRSAIWRGNHFPLLADFESQLELRLWQPTGRSRISLSGSHNATGRQALEVTGSGRWVGASYLAGQIDWTPFASLGFEIYNPAEPFDMTLRVDDDRDTSDYAERYNRTIRIKPGWNEILVPIEEIRAGPKARLLNTARITRVYFAIPGTKTPREFFLDNVRLEP